MTNGHPDYPSLGYCRIGTGVKGDVMTNVDTFKYRAVWMVLLAKPGSTIQELAAMFGMSTGAMESRLIAANRRGFFISEGDNDDLYALRDGDLRYAAHY